MKEERSFAGEWQNGIVSAIVDERLLLLRGISVLSEAAIAKKPQAGEDDLTVSGDIRREWPLVNKRTEVAAYPRAELAKSVTDTRLHSTAPEPSSSSRNECSMWHPAHDGIRESMQIVLTFLFSICRR